MAPASVKNGNSGRPGIRPRMTSSEAATKRARGWAPSWPNTAWLAEPRVPPLETSMPAASETIRAGIWVTRPSPTDSLMKTSAAWPRPMPWRR